MWVLGIGGTSYKSLYLCMFEIFKFKKKKFMQFELHSYINI